MNFQLNIYYIPFVCALYSISLITRQTKVHELAGDDYRSSVLESIKRWIQVALVGIICFSIFHIYLKLVKHKDIFYSLRIILKFF